MNRWTSTPRLVGLAVLVALVTGAVELARTGDLAAGGRSAGAGLIAGATLALALSLAGAELRGLVIGGFFVVAGIFTWTFTYQPKLIWVVLLAQGALFILWSRPWPARARDLPRLGTFYLGVAYWVLGALGALLSAHPGVFAQRVLYGGVFALSVMAVLVAVRRGVDPSVGIAVTLLIGVAALLLAGSPDMFDKVHAVPSNPSAQLMRYRFWGGPLLWYHPNSLAGLAVAAAVRIGPDRAFRLWQRLAATALAGFVVSITNSRIGFVFLAAAAVVHAVVVLWERGERVPQYKWKWIAVGLPFVVLVIILVQAHGQGFLTQERFSSGGFTSGRTDTWRQVWVDWKHDGIAEKLFGDSKTSRAVVVRYAPDGSNLNLNTDNAAVGAFRRGGVLGEVAFLGGLVLLAWRAWVGRHWIGLFRRGPGQPPAWFTVAGLAAIPTLATEDWLLGGTNGALWILLVAGEAVVRYAGATVGVAETTGVSHVSMGDSGGLPAVSAPAVRNPADAPMASPDSASYDLDTEPDSPPAPKTRGSADANGDLDPVDS